MSDYDGKVVFKYEGDTTGIDAANNTAESKVKSGSGKMAAAAKIGTAAVAAGVVAIGAAAISYGSEFETSMAAASTLFGDAAVNTDALNEKMLALSSSSGVAADELGGSLYNALSAGIPATDDMSEAMDFLESSTELAKAGFTDVDTAMSATVKTMNAYGEGVEEADRIQKILMQTQNGGIVTVGELGSVLSNVTPTAAAMGVEFEQIGASIAVMTAAGTPAAQATTQLNSLFAELGKEGTKASLGLADALEGTENAGKSFQDLMNEGIPLNEVIDLMGQKAEENGLGMLDMFSSIEAGKAALAVGGENSDKFAASLASMATEADVVGDAFDKVTGTSAEQFDKMLNELKNTAIDLFLQLQPLITEAMPILKTVMDELIPPLLELVQMLMPYLVELFDALLPPIGELITALMPILVELFNTLLPPILELITLLMPLIVDCLVPLMPLFTTLIELLMPIIQLFMDLLVPLMELIEMALPPLIEIIVWLVNKALVPLQNTLGIVAEVLTSSFGGAIDYLKKQLTVVKDIFKNVIDFIKNVFTGNWKAAFENIKNIFSSIWTSIKNMVKLPMNTIIDAVNGLIGGLNKMTIPDWVPVVGGKGFHMPKIPRLKVGMDYVPSDMFPAYLDEGERVLTKQQNADYNSLSGMLSALMPMLGQNSQTMVVQTPVYLDGALITTSVNEHNYTDVSVRRIR